MGLHSLVERVLIARLGAWEVRRHPESDRHHEYFAPRGFLHLQLWNPDAQVSILTPSALTGGRFAVWRDGIRIAVRAWADVVAQLPDLPLPGEAELAALHLWTVVRDAIDTGAPEASAGRVGS